MMQDENIARYFAEQLMSKEDWQIVVEGLAVLNKVLEIGEEPDENVEKLMKVLSKITGATVPDYTEAHVKPQEVEEEEKKHAEELRAEYARGFKDGEAHCEGELQAEYKKRYKHGFANAEKFFKQERAESCKDWPLKFDKVYCMSVSREPGSRGFVRDEGVTSSTLNLKDILNELLP